MFFSQDPCTTPTSAAFRSPSPIDKMSETTPPNAPRKTYYRNRRRSCEQLRRSHTDYDNNELSVILGRDALCNLHTTESEFNTPRASPVPPQLPPMNYIGRVAFQSPNGPDLDDSPGLPEIGTRGHARRPNFVLGLRTCPRMFDDDC